MTATPTLRLTQYAAGGGCACKVPPGELERVLADLPGGRGTVHTDEVGELLVGLEHGDDAAAVRIAGGQWQREMEEYEPDGTLAGMLEERYQVYARLYDAWKIAMAGMDAGRLFGKE